MKQTSEGLMTKSILPVCLAGTVAFTLAARAQAQTQTQTQTQAQTQAQTCPGQDVATHQTSSAFNSITDGQPGTPRQPQITTILSDDFGEEEFQSQFSIGTGVIKSGFWCQAQFALNAPTLVVGDSLVDFERSVTMSWQQRWHIDKGYTPTVSTLVAVRQPYDEPDEKTGLTISGIIAKSTSWGAAYLNAFGKTSDGVAIDNFEYGGVVGVKRIIKDELAVFADMVFQEQGAYALEFSLQRDWKNGWTLGPGASVARVGSGDDNLDVSVGISVAKTFSR